MTATRARRSALRLAFDVVAAAAVSLVAAAGCGDPPRTDGGPAVHIAPLPRTERLEPKGPFRHPVVLWTYGDDLTAPGFTDAAKHLGATAVQAPPECDLGPVRAAGLAWYEDHAAGKGTLGLRETEWRPAWDVAYQARREEWPAESVRARPRCLRDPERVAAMTAGVVAAGRRAASGALWISLEDEPSATVRANPSDWCLCERCVAEFRRRAVAERTLAELNAAWGTEYGGIGEIRPWTTAAIRARELRKPSSSWRLAPWIETRRFQDETFAEVVASLRAAARGASGGDVPTGLTGIQTPSAFGGFDLARLLGGGDFAEPYDIGLAMPIARDVLAPGAVLAQTVFPSDDVRVSRWRMWRGIGRGANATIVWSSRDALRRGADGSFRPTPYGEALQQDLRRLAAPDGVGAQLARARPADGGIAIGLSHTSVQVRWMLDSVEDGDTWPRRFGSHEATHSTAIRSREAAWRSVAQRSPRFVDLDRAGGPDLNGVRALLLPDTIALGDSAVAAIRDFAERGGIVVADVESGAFDGAGNAAPRGRLRGAAVSPGFKDVPTRLAGLGAPWLSAETGPLRGSPTPSPEISLFVDGASRIAVCVLPWEIGVSDDGSSVGSLPAGNVSWAIRFGDGRPRTVTELRTGTELGSAASFVYAADAAEPVVLAWVE